MECGSCIWTERLVRELVGEVSAHVAIDRVTELSDVTPHRIMSTPPIVTAERVVHAGGSPTKEEVRSWLLASQA